MEGVTIDPDGSQIAVVLSDCAVVQIYRRAAAELTVPVTPYYVLPADNSGLRYPHDVDFSPDARLLAVADRECMVMIYAKRDRDGGYGPEPVCQITGEISGLAFSDAVAFIPPDGAVLAACNLTSNKITFYRRKHADVQGFENAPFYELQGGEIYKPDGLAISRNGKWLAVANHGRHSISVFRRNNNNNGEFSFELESVIKDRSIRYAHSVAFTPRHNHLLLTNAGANYVNIYRTNVSKDGHTTWTNVPSQQLLTGNDIEFSKINARNKMEGGPKGIAVDGRTIALCRPESGLSLYAYTEYPKGVVLRRKQRPSFLNRIFS